MADAENCRGVRRRIREGVYSGSTAGLCSGFIQANVVVLCAGFADDFAEYCRLNPKPCPLIAIGGRGDPYLSGVGSDIDIRTDVAAYCIHRHGKPEPKTTSIADHWTEDMVTFALGCSFSFENALISAGIRMRHIEDGSVVPMYRTNVDTVPSGRFRGKLVVSMRPIQRRLVDIAVEVSARYPHSHGAPVHVGAPGDLGITDLIRPDWGDPPDMGGDEVPVFWACGVTSQQALRSAKPPLAITHHPGSMLITELDEDSEISIPGLEQRDEHSSVAGVRR